MSQEYVVFHGKVTKVKKISPGYGERITYTTECGTTVAGAHGDYRCDENGKSLKTGEYLNTRDDFFPWVNGVFDERRLERQLDIFN